MNSFEIHVEKHIMRLKQKKKLIKRQTNERINNAIRLLGK